MSSSLPHRELFGACRSVGSVEAALEHVLQGEKQPPIILVELADEIARNWINDVMLAYEEALRSNQEARLLLGEEIVKHSAERYAQAIRDLSAKQPDAKVVLVISDAVAASDGTSVTNSEANHMSNLLKYLTLKPKPKAEGETGPDESTRTRRRQEAKINQAHPDVKTFNAWLDRHQHQDLLYRKGTESPTSLSSLWRQLTSLLSVSDLKLRAHQPI
jgi:hypothetical protein